MAPQPRRPVGCCRSCLRGCLRGLNYLLAIIGVLMVAYSVFMYIQWSEATPKPPSPPPAEAPSSVASTASRFIQHASRSSESLKSIERPGTDRGDAIDVVTSADHEMASDEQTATDDKSSDDHKKKHPWFIYVVGGAGFAVFITASVGILSADCAACGVTCFMGLYHTLMVFLLLIQIAVVCFYFFDKSWEEQMPDDATGEYDKLKHLVMHHLRACKIIALATLGLQLMALMVSCTLYYAENKPYYERLITDYDSASQAAGPSSRRLMSGNGARGDPWTSRNAAKYGASSEGGGSRGYDPEVARAPGLGDDEVAEVPKRGCTIM